MGSKIRFLFVRYAFSSQSVERTQEIRFGDIFRHSSLHTSPGHSLTLVDQRIRNENHQIRDGKNAYTSVSFRSDGRVPGGFCSSRLWRSEILSIPGTDFRNGVPSYAKASCSKSSSNPTPAIGRHGIWPNPSPEERKFEERSPDSGKRKQPMEWARIGPGDRRFKMSDLRP